jgi:hypothetical protein
VTAAGDRYDAAVREIWAGIDQGLSTREAWALARPGMVAAQRQMDVDLAAVRDGASPGTAIADPEAGS